MDYNNEELESFFDEVIVDYKEGTSRLQKTLPRVTKGYFDFTQACFENGSIDQKYKQLMAIAISIYARDEYCIMHHTKAAVELDVTEEEIMETVAISSALGGGSAFSQGVTLAIDSFNYYHATRS